MKERARCTAGIPEGAVSWTGRAGRASAALGGEEAGLVCGGGDFPRGVGRSRL